MNGLKNVRNRRSDALTRVAWDELENLLAVHYRGLGFQVDHVGTGGSGARFDGGIDLKLRKDDAYILVQCKHWNAKQVPHNEVHQLIGLMVNESATGAILITSGEFTRYAIESAEKQGHVELIDGTRLREMIGPLPEEADDSPRRVDPSGGWSQPSPRYRSSRRSPARDSSSRRFGRFALALVAALILMAVFYRGLVAFNRSILQPHAAAAVLPVAPSGPVAPDYPPPNGPSTARRAPAIATRSPASGATLPADTAIGAFDQREHERRNAEAMKILEKTTPEAQ